MNPRGENQANMGTPLHSGRKGMKASEDGSKIWDKEEKEILLFEIEKWLKNLAYAKRRKSSDASPQDARAMTIGVLGAVIGNYILDVPL